MIRLRHFRGLGLEGKIRTIPIAIGGAAVLILVATILIPTVAQGAVSNKGRHPHPLSNPRLFDSSFQVTPGSLVSLHWSGQPAPSLPSGAHYVVESSLPDFASTSVVRWPPKSSPPPTWDGTGWSTTARAMTVTIPANAAPGIHYVVAVLTCNSKTCAARATSAVLNVPPSPIDWGLRSFRSDFSHVATFASPGNPFATVFLTSGTSIWSASEFSHDITEIPTSAKVARLWKVTPPTGAAPVFKEPFTLCLYSSCQPSATSALGESITTSNGWIWLTFGGDRTLPGFPSPLLPSNHSEVVAFDPGTHRFCSYLVPGNNNQVAGIASSGVPPDSHIWFVESRGTAGQGSLDGFNPSRVGNGCQGQANEAYVLPASVRLLKWSSRKKLWPVQIAVDPLSPSLWITNFNSYGASGTQYSEIDRVDISDPAEPRIVKRYAYPSTNPSSYYGAKPWAIVAPPGSNYVYAMDNGDAEIVRINKVTSQIDEVPIPLTSDAENGFGLAISSDRLYFTLANDYGEIYGTASTFGYIDLSSWPADSPPTKGVIYTGLSRVTDPGTVRNYRAIAVSPSGRVSITDQHATIRLTP
jgi:hypothetical protein